jgi:hypothetical protein
MSWGKIFTIYTGAFILFTILLALAEYAQLIPNRGIAYTYLIVTIGVYALIGILSRTARPDQYYVAGRGVPAFFNGMATGADWMSAASFISMAGALYSTGYDGLAYVSDWTGGYVLLAIFLAPFLRKFGADAVRDVTDAYQHLVRLRLAHQLAQLERGEPPDNYLDPKTLSHADAMLFRDALWTVRRVQAEIGERYGVRLLR